MNRDACNASASADARGLCPETALPTRLQINGAAIAYAPLNRSTFCLPDIPWRSGLLAASAAIPDQYSRASAWRRLAQKARREPVHIVVLGSSVTAGCGAEEPWDPFLTWQLETSTPRPKLSRLCSVERSWSRWMADELTRLLDAAHPQSPRPRFELRVEYKNAVGANYFASCTHRFVPPGTDLARRRALLAEWLGEVDLAARRGGHSRSARWTYGLDTWQVLIEMSTNTWGGYMGRLLGAVRRQAPAAALGFVNWAWGAAVEIEDAARAQGADVRQRALVTPLVARRATLTDGKRPPCLTTRVTRVAC